MTDPHHRPSGDLDPTKMANQPALRTSSGRIWLIMGGLFAAASLIPFSLLAFAGSGRSSLAAIVIGAAIIVLYLAMIVVRLITPQGPLRLRMMAAGMLTMAALALIGIWICMTLERAPA